MPLIESPRARPARSQVGHALRSLAALNVVGADIVEVAPAQPPPAGIAADRGRVRYARMTARRRPGAAARLAR